MSNIYDTHAKAFSLVSAGVLVKDGQRIGTLAFKFPKDGAGRLTCFFHIHGHRMVKGAASGYGYDKQGAALEVAINNLGSEVLEEHPSLVGFDTNGDSFDGALRKCGIEYWSAV